MMVVEVLNSTAGARAGDGVCGVRNDQVFCDASHISISACLPLFIEVCESVQRALVAMT